MMLVGDVATSERAAKLGMVNRVVDDDKLMDEALAYAQRLAAMPRASVAEIKQLVHQGIALPLEEGLRLEQDAFWRVMTSEDAQRLMKEYAEGGQNASF